MLDRKASFWIAIAKGLLAVGICGYHRLEAVSGLLPAGSPCNSTTALLDLTTPPKGLCTFRIVDKLRTLSGM
jgi:hypothetical protein